MIKSLKGTMENDSLEVSFMQVDFAVLAIMLMMRLRRRSFSALIRNLILTTTREEHIRLQNRKTTSAIAKKSYLTYIIPTSIR